MTVLQDLRYAFSNFRRNPVFTAVAILTLALGIGANSAVFSVINAVLLRPLPYEDPDRLTLVWTNFGADLPQNWVSGPELVEIEELNSLFEEIAAVVPSTANLTGQGDPVEISVGLATGSLFHLLGVEPAQGRLFEPGDDEAGAETVVVLGHGFWQRRYGGDKAVIGETLRADGQPYTVVGVLPQGFEIAHPDAQFPDDIDVWTPMAPALVTFFGATDFGQLPRGAHFLRVFARMKPGVEPAQAQADMDAVALAMQEKSPDYYDFEGWGITVLPLHDDLVEDVKPALLILLGAVGLVLLIACLNVANLMLTRAASREREIAVRTALGAGRLRLIRQLMTESLALSLLGGAMGLALALGLLRILSAVVPANLPRGDEIYMDGGVLLFTFLIAVLTGVLFGLAPGLHAVKQDLAQSFKEGGRGATSLRGNHMRSLLVAAEIGVALVLLVGAGLLVRSFVRLMDSDPGYRTDRVLTLRLSLPASKSPTDVVAFYDRLRERLRALPGVESVGTISHLPLSGSYASGTTRVNESLTVPDREDQAIEADRRRVSPDYFRTMGVSLIKGRTFTEADDAQSPLVAVVDEEFVRRFWSTEDPLGKQISIDGNDDGRIWREVVGVVRHSKHYDLATVGREQVYMPYKQRPTNTMYLALRTTGDPSALGAAVRSEVWSIDSQQPVADTRTMAGRIDSAVAQPRFNLLLLGGFAGLALVLAAVGIYGVISYSVTQRSHEIGVRMALGAAGSHVVAMVMRQVLTVVAAGLGVGTVLAFALTRLLEGLLYTTDPADPGTYAAVVLLLTLVAVAACSLPALRAVRVEPVKVLHDE